MPERNRVTPLGRVVAIPLRGNWTGNRGRLHEVHPDGSHEIARFHNGNLWIICVLEFRGRWDEQWRPNRFTWLYFQDEAVALAAGHRPCGECRHSAYAEYQSRWAEALGGDRPTAGEMNRQLHAERLWPRSRRRRFHEMAWKALPDGAFALVDGSPWLVRDSALVRWTTQGYAERRPRPANGTVEVITPPSSVAVLSAGYPVQIDASAG